MRRCSRSRFACTCGHGTVSHAEVLKPVRGDLDAEALELVKTWTYQPGACEGTKQFFALDAEVRFQGR